MGTYDKQPSKVKPTAGPAEGDRFGEGPVTSDFTSRIQAREIKDGGLRVTLLGGMDKGVRVGMMGYLKVGADACVDLQIIDVKQALSYAMLPGVTLEDIVQFRDVVINPTSRPAQPLGNVPGKVVAWEVIPLGTRITVSKGIAHGIIVGTPGYLRSKEGRGSFVVTDASLTRSRAIVHEPVDFVKDHQELVLVRIAAAPRRGG